MANDLWIWVLLFSMFGVLMIFIIIAANRKMKGFRLIDLKDFRNPSKGAVRRWAMFNSAKDAYIKIYSNIFRPMKNGVTPPHDLKGFDWAGNVFALVGVSGHPEDDNRVLIHIPIVGQAGAVQYSQEMSAAVINTESMKDEILKQGLKFDDKVEYEAGEYTIKDLSYRGAVLAYYDTVNSKGSRGEDIQRQVEKTKELTELSEIRKLNVISSNADNRIPGLQDFFSPDWVFETLGVVPVEDGNLILRPDKDAISSFNSKVTDRQQSVMSLFGRYPWLIPMSIMTFVVIIGSVIFFYGVSQTVTSSTTQIAGTATAAINHIAGLGANQTIPKPT